MGVRVFVGRGRAAVVAAAVVSACGQLRGGGRADEERVAAFLELARRLPLCPSGTAGQALDDAFGSRWEAGQCGLLRGWLELVRDPPPCGDETAADPAARQGAAAPPGACGVGWVLSPAPPGDASATSGPRRRLGLANVLNDRRPPSCTRDEDDNLVLPGVRPMRLLEPRDDRDLDAAARAMRPVQVAVLGAIPDDDRDPRCEPELMVGCGPQQRRLGARPFEVSHVCRLETAAAAGGASRSVGEAHDRTVKDEP